MEMKTARQLAAFMLQMVYGDRDETKHVPDKIELVELNLTQLF